MPLLTLQDLATPLTRQQVERSIYETLRQLGVPTTSWKPGGVARALTTSFAVMVAAFSEVTAAVTKSGFLDTAEGPWLTLLAKSTFNVDRIGATYATGEVTLANNAGGLYVLEPKDLIFRNTRTDKTYVNTEAVTIQPMKSVTVKIRAQEIGSESNANPGEIAELVTTLAGVSCTNEASVIGLEEESDEALRVRCREYMSALSPFGPTEAYSYWAKSAERDGTNLGVTRVKVKRLSDYGEVDVTVATASGGVGGEDLSFLDELLREKVVPLGVRMYLQSASAKDVEVSYQLWTTASTMTDEDIKTAVRARLDAFLRQTPIGGHVLVENEPGCVFRDAMIEAIRTAIPGQIVRVLLDGPAADVELAENEIPVLGTVAATITRIG